MIPMSKLFWRAFSDLLTVSWNSLHLQMQGLLVGIIQIFHGIKIHQSQLLQLIYELLNCLVAISLYIVQNVIWVFYIFKPILINNLWV